MNKLLKILLTDPDRTADLVAHKPTARNQLVHLIPMELELISDLLHRQEGHRQSSLANM